MIRRPAARLVAAGIAALMAIAMAGTTPASASTTPGWSQVPFPSVLAPLDGLAGVSCPAASKCVAVGQSVNRAGADVRLVKAWNGRRWAVQRGRIPAGARSSTLAGVSCSSARACIAVGHYTSRAGVTLPLAERWNGRRWAILGVPGGAVLAGVSCTSATACTAVGGFTNRVGSTTPRADRWNGRKWAAQHVPGTASGDNALNGVSCTSARSCTAVGYSNNGDDASVPVAERWNGRRWAAQRIPAVARFVFSFLKGVSCASARSCTAVGNTTNSAGDAAAPLAERWNGRSWALQRIPGVPGPGFSVLTGVSCASARSCTAVGNAVKSDFSATSPLAETWNGTDWAIQATARLADEGSLAAVSCSSARPCIAVGAAIGHLRGSQTLAERRRGATWHIQSTPGNPVGAVNSSLAAVSCTSVSACTAVGSGLGPLAARWDGRTWSIEKIPTPAAALASVLAGVSCTSATACIAVGDYRLSDGSDVPLAERWDGSTWSIQQTPAVAGGFSSLTGISCTSATACIAVGTGSSPLAERWDGTTWALQPPAAGVGALSGVSCTSAAACTAVGNPSSGTAPPAAAERWDGTMWTLQSVPGIIGSPTGVSCASALACTAVGSSDTAFRWNGTTWSVQPTAPARGDLAGVSCHSALACTAVGGQDGAHVSDTVPLVEHWDGLKWAIQRPPTPRGSRDSSLQGVSCTSVQACIAVGFYLNGNIRQALVERHS